MDKAIARLYRYLEFKNIKPTRFEKDIGLSNGYLKKQLNRNAGLGEEIILKIVENCLDLSPYWFVFGHGEMLTKNTKNVPILNGDKKGDIFGTEPNVQKKSSMQSNDLIELTPVPEAQASEIKQLMRVIEEQSIALKQMSKMLMDTQDDEMNELIARRKRIEKNGK